MHMTSVSQLNRRRFKARLPNGEFLAVGFEHDEPDLVRCPGPSPRGGCPILMNGGRALCDGAVWFDVDQPERQFSFALDRTRPPSIICPVTTLYPL